MTAYRISFVNDLVDSHGHPHHVCQRHIEVRGAIDGAGAVERAKREFERLERIERWQLRARAIELESIES